MTNVDDKQAKFYLEAANWDMEVGVFQKSGLTR